MIEGVIETKVKARGNGTHLARLEILDVEMPRVSAFRMLVGILLLAAQEKTVRDGVGRRRGNGMHRLRELLGIAVQTAERRSTWMKENGKRNRFD